jgi:hypothetical protein
MPSGDMQRHRMNAHKFTNPGLQNRRLQVRFLSHLPHFSLISWGLEPLSLSPLTAVVTAVRAALELNTNENWSASTYWAPTLETISSRFKCPHEHCQPHGISLQNGRARCACCLTRCENHEFTFLAGSWTQRKVCFDPNFIPPGATPQVSACSLLVMDS